MVWGLCFLVKSKMRFALHSFRLAFGSHSGGVLLVESIGMEMG
jgi:hypothetical protein